jgi:Protein of unknown function (DUF2637)
MSIANPARTPGRSEIFGPSKRPLLGMRTDEAFRPAHSAHGDFPARVSPGSSGDDRQGLSSVERAAAVAVVVLVALLGVIGAVNSFAAVAAAVEPSFGRLAWTVPVGIDVGIAAFTALDLLLARVGMRMRLLRLVPWCLVGVTVYLNVAGERHPIGAVAHGVLPLLWVIAVESGGHAARAWAGLDGRGDEGRGRRLDRVRWSRWLLAPASTLRLWRRMVLWETPSYVEALRRERERVLARTDLQDTWGVFRWRWRAPRRSRALYRLGELAPAGALPVRESTPAERTPAKPRSSGGGRSNSRAKQRVAVGLDELVAASRAVAAELAEDGVRLTRATLLGRLRARGLPVSNARAGELLALLRRGPTTTDDGRSEAVAR